MDVDNKPLSFLEYHTSNSETILVIHGGSYNVKELARVAAVLPNYHVLIPKYLLNGETTDSGQRPLALPQTSDLIASLISQHARDSRAHIVGCSLGSHIALHLATDHPEVVKDVFISGFHQAEESFWKPVYPYGFSLLQRLEFSFVGSAVMRMADIVECEGESFPPQIVAYARQVMDTMAIKFDTGKLRSRTLICVAGKRNILLPTNDNLEMAKDLRDSIVKSSSKGEECRLVHMPTMRHGWWLQDPALFASSVLAWFERRDLPKELELL